MALSKKAEGSTELLSVVKLQLLSNQITVDVHG